jgi:TonB C terminal
MRHPTRVLKVVLAFSLALHVVILWWQRIPTPRAQHPETSLSIQSPVEVTPGDVPPGRILIRPPSEPAPPRQGPKRRKREAGRSGTHTDPLASDVPRAEQGPERPTLLPSPEVLVLPPGGERPVSPPEPGPPGTRLRAPEHPASLQELVAETVRDAVARRRVENGLAHSYFGDMGKQFLRRFGQRHADVERGMTAREKVARKARDVSSVLSRSAEMEDPLAHPRRPDPLASGPSLHSSLEEAQRNLAYSLPYLWTYSEGATVVRLTQAADGKVLAVEVITPSGNGELDKAAVMAVWDLGEALPALPPEVLMSRDSVVSEWRFEVQRTVAGPAALGVGAVGTFDPVLGTGEVLHSFAGRSDVQVTLVSYY